MSNAIFLPSYYTCDLIPKNSQWTLKEIDKLLAAIPPIGNVVDWDAVATLVGSKSAMECFMQYRNFQCPSINKELWSNSEIADLGQLAIQFGEHDWPLIAHKLGTNRTPLDCLKYYQRNINSKLHNPDKFTPEEDQALIDASQKYSSNQFQYMASCLPSRSAVQCNTRWRKLQARIDGVGGLQPEVSSSSSLSSPSSMLNSSRSADITTSTSSSSSIVSSRWTRDEEKRLFIIGLALKLPMSLEQKKSISSIELLKAADNPILIAQLIRSDGIHNPGSQTEEVSAITEYQPLEVNQSSTNSTKKRKYNKRSQPTAAITVESTDEIEAISGVIDAVDDSLSSKKLSKIWPRVASLMEGRSEIQCREKWTNTLDPSLNHSIIFTAAEDALLCKLLPVYGVGNWSQLSQWFHGRTDAMLSKRYLYLQSQGVCI